MTKIRKLLNDIAGFAEIEFIIPHTFLPPRYQKRSRSRNMILILDKDLQVAFKWEGELVGQVQPLSASEVGRLMTQALDRMAKYRREIRSFQKFLESSAKIEEEAQIIATIKAEDQGSEYLEQLLSNPGSGGESPYPFGW